jgi:hypothetical protein
MTISSISSSVLWANVMGAVVLIAPTRAIARKRGCGENLMVLTSVYSFTDKYNPIQSYT